MNAQDIVHQAIVKSCLKERQLIKEKAKQSRVTESLMIQYQINMLLACRQDLIRIYEAIIEE